MSEWTQQLQDYWKLHCQDNSWKNVSLSVPQSSMLAFIEHIEFLTTLSNYWEDIAKINKNTENELLMCKHVSATMTQLHDEKCKKITELQSTIATQQATIDLLKADGERLSKKLMDVWQDASEACYEVTLHTDLMQKLEKEG